MKTPLFSYHGYNISQKIIAWLSSPDGLILTNHNQKPQLLLESFKNRMGLSELSCFHYDLSSLLSVRSLEHMDASFSLEEINSAIKCVLNSHAPGPDGFNGMFIKKCWNIVEDDFLRQFRDFCNTNLDLRTINSSHIALIPKKSNPESIDILDLSPC